MRLRCVRVQSDSNDRRERAHLRVRREFDRVCVTRIESVIDLVKFEKVNHRLDAGYTYSIELSPYAQMRSFTAIVRVGLHPNASQAHAELPNVKTVSRQFLAHVD